MGSDPIDGILLGDEFSKVMHGTIRPCYLHAPNVAFTHRHSDCALRRHKSKYARLDETDKPFDILFSPCFILSSLALALSFFGRTGSSPARAGWGTKVKRASLHYPVSTTRTMLSENTARMGDKARPSGASASADGFAV